jgi:hypothetical protein
MEYTVPLALQDYMTVIFSAVGLALLTSMVAQLDRELGRMALIGTILTVAGGAFKATGKLVLAMGGPDVAVLNLGLFPLIAPGFTLMVWSLYQIRRSFRDQPPLRRPWLVPLLIIGLVGAGSAAIFNAGGPWRVPLIALASLANILMLSMLAIASWRRGLRQAAGLFVFTLVVVLVMSQLASIPFDRIEIIWFEQVSQTIAQALFAFASWQYGQQILAQYRRPLVAQAA